MMRWLAAILVLSASSAALGQSTTAHPLSSAQRAAVERGEPVQVLEPLSTSPWPRSIVHQFIDATPEECAAVLSDYELQAKYIPRIKVARIVRRSGIETDVQYLIDIPVYPDEHSISRQRVVADTGGYRVLWHTLVDPRSGGSVTTGSATFTPMTNSRTRKRGTLMIHDQTVVPSSAFAKVPFVRNKAIDANRDAARAIAGQVERERASDAKLLARQVARLREGLTSAR